jgi:hypothetical protein
MKIRAMNDTNGMFEDLEQFYLKLTKEELVELLMKERHVDQGLDDFLDDWSSFCNGLVTAIDE